MNTKQFVRSGTRYGVGAYSFIVPKVPIGGGYAYFSDSITYVAASIFDLYLVQIVGAIGHSFGRFYFWLSDILYTDIYY